VSAPDQILEWLDTYEVRAPETHAQAFAALRGEVEAHPLLSGHQTFAGRYCPECARRVPCPTRQRIAKVLEVEP
jgi:hypothetical protein